MIYSIAFAFGAATLPQAAAIQVKRDGTDDWVLGMSQKATYKDNIFQPLLDFDGDSCYNVAAIDESGKLNPGVDIQQADSITYQCRDVSDLDYNQVYVRERCNGGRCAIMYDYYWKHDISYIDEGQSLGDNITPKHVYGHQHEWEHIIVWNDKDDHATHVSVSQHGGWQTLPADQIAWDGTHPKIVYHKDGGLTHNFRFASGDDLNRVENESGKWRTSSIMSWDYWPSQELKDKMMNANWGDAAIAIKDSAFQRELDKAGKPAGWESFDTSRDDESTNHG